MERYEYVGTAGSGAYGAVWCCRVGPLPEECGDGLVPGQLVACKVFKSAHTDKEIMRLALREVKVLKSTNHPNCVKLLDAFKSKSGKVYLIFEYVERCAYKELCIHRLGLPAKDLKLMAYQLCLGLRYMHSSKMVHRDIKPSNILITDEGLVKLCDFGFARTTSCADPRDAERLSSYVVTRWYRAPEVLLSMEYGPAADIWALGCTIAELAVGEPLMPGTSTVDQLWRVMRVMRGPLPPHMSVRLVEDPRLAALRVPPRGRRLAQRLAHVGPRLVQFIEACLQLDPVARPTAEELMSLPYFFEVPNLVAGTPIEAHILKEASMCLWGSGNRQHTGGKLQAAAFVSPMAGGPGAAVRAGAAAEGGHAAGRKSRQLTAPGLTAKGSIPESADSVMDHQAAMARMEAMVAAVAVGASGQPKSADAAGEPPGNATSVAGTTRSQQDRRLLAPVAGGAGTDAGAAGAGGGAQEGAGVTCGQLDAVAHGQQSPEPEAQAKLEMGPGTPDGSGHPPVTSVSSESRDGKQEGVEHIPVLEALEVGAKQRPHLEQAARQQLQQQERPLLSVGAYGGQQDSPFHALVPSAEMCAQQQQQQQVVLATDVSLCGGMARIYSNLATAELQGVDAAAAAAATAALVQARTTREREGSCGGESWFGSGAGQPSSSRSRSQQRHSHSSHDLDFQLQPPNEEDATPFATAAPTAERLLAAVVASAAVPNAEQLETVAEGAAGEGSSSCGTADMHQLRQTLSRFLGCEGSNAASTAASGSDINGGDVNADAAPPARWLGRNATAPRATMQDDAPGPHQPNQLTYSASLPLPHHGGSTGERCSPNGPCGVLSSATTGNAASATTPGNQAKCIRQSHLPRLAGASAADMLFVQPAGAPRVSGSGSGPLTSGPGSSTPSHMAAASEPLFLSPGSASATPGSVTRSPPHLFLPQLHAGRQSGTMSPAGHPHVHVQAQAQGYFQTHGSPRGPRRSVGGGLMGCGASPLGMGVGMGAGPGLLRTRMSFAGQDWSNGTQSGLLTTGEFQEIGTPMGAPTLSSNSSHPFPYRRPPPLSRVPSHLLSTSSIAPLSPSGHGSPSPRTETGVWAHASQQQSAAGSPRVFDFSQKGMDRSSSAYLAASATAAAALHAAHSRRLALAAMHADAEGRRLPATPPHAAACGTASPRTVNVGRQLRNQLSGLVARSATAEAELALPGRGYPQTRSAFPASSATGPAPGSAGTTMPYGLADVPTGSAASWASAPPATPGGSNASTPLGTGVEGFSAGSPPSSTANAAATVQAYLVPTSPPDEGGRQLRHCGSMGGGGGGGGGGGAQSTPVRVSSAGSTPTVMLLPALVVNEPGTSTRSPRVQLHRLSQSGNASQGQSQGGHVSPGQSAGLPKVVMPGNGSSSFGGGSNSVPVSPVDGGSLSAQLVYVGPGQQVPGVLAAGGAVGSPWLSTVPSARLPSMPTMNEADEDARALGNQASGGGVEVSAAQALKSGVYTDEAGEAAGAHAGPMVGDGSGTVYNSGGSVGASGGGGSGGALAAAAAEAVVLSAAAGSSGKKTLLDRAKGKLKKLFSASGSVGATGSKD